MARRQRTTKKMLHAMKKEEAGQYSEKAKKVLELVLFGNESLEGLAAAIEKVNEHYSHLESEARTLVIDEIKTLMAIKAAKASGIKPSTKLKFIKSTRFGKSFLPKMLKNAKKPASSKEYKEYISGKVKDTFRKMNEHRKWTFFGSYESLKRMAAEIKENPKTSVSDAIPSEFQSTVAKKIANELDTLAKIKAAVIEESHDAIEHGMKRLNYFSKESHREFLPEVVDTVQSPYSYYSEYDPVVKKALQDLYDDLDSKKQLMGSPDDIHELAQDIASHAIDDTDTKVAMELSKLAQFKKGKNPEGDGTIPFTYDLNKKEIINVGLKYIGPDFMPNVFANKKTETQENKTIPEPPERNVGPTRS